MAYGQAGGREQATQLKGPSISGALADLDPVISRADDYAKRLEEICSRLRGPAPTGGLKANGGDSAIPVSIIASINERRSHLVNSLDLIESSIRDLENIL